MNGVVSFVRALGPGRLAAMGAVAAGLIGFFAFLILRLTEPQMTLLYADLDIRDSNAIVKELEARDIAFELRADGAAILVPKDDVLRLRMSFAEDGLPAGGTMGYELFDRSDALGTTSFVQNINHLRALEGELSRTIRAIDRIQAARVHLVLPERELFSRDKVDPSASIVVKTRGELSAAQIRSIQHLVASAVKGLKPSRISIVDESGTLLASGTEDDTTAAMAATFEERRLGLEHELRRQIEEIVASVVGPNRTKVTVTAELGYNRVTQTSDVFDPEGRVVRSTQTREEKQDSTTNAPTDGVSVGNELPGANAATANGAGGSRDQNDKTEEIVNYEISRTTKTEVVEPGAVKKISVAVLVDGIYSKDASGTASYAPRPQEQLDQIATLVRSAIGYDRARGDLVEVINLQFAEVATNELPAEEPAAFEFSKEDYFYIAELAVLLIVAALVLLFVVRPLVRRIVTPEAPPMLNAEGGEMKQLTGPDGRPVEGAERTAALPGPDNKTAEMIEFAQFNGQIQASSIQKVGEMLDDHPDEAVAIIRQWLGDAA